MKRGTTEEHISQAAALLARRRAGLKERRSAKKKRSNQANLEKARMKRWIKKVLGNQPPYDPEFLRNHKKP